MARAEHLAALLNDETLCSCGDEAYWHVIVDALSYCQVDECACEQFNDESGVA